MSDRETNDGRLRMTRRGLLGLGAGLFGAWLSAACSLKQVTGGDSSMGSKWLAQQATQLTRGRLAARPREVKTAGAAGLQQLELESGRDGFIYVPAAYRSERRAPLLLMLHGAGGNARNSLPLLQNFADKTGLLLLIPDSRATTWDAISGDYGRDVAFIERALEQTFTRYNVDQAHLAIGGFSDGASYALSLGTTNGDLFTHVVAFSPGFMAPASRHGSPALYISHGTRDRVLPIDACSRKIVPQVKSAGYKVLYREFDGAHTVPADIAREAIDWFLKDEGAGV